jgi:molybdate transport system permease protein
MPNAIYVALQSDPDTALVISVILMFVSVAVLALLRERWFDVAVQGAVRR